MRFKRRTLAEVINLVVTDLGEGQPISLIVEAVREKGTHGEWEQWAGQSVSNKVRQQLNRSGRYSIAGGYQTLLTLEDYVLVAKAQAGRGRDFFGRVQALADECQEKLSVTFDADAIIAEVLGQAK